MDAVRVLLQRNGVGYALAGTASVVCINFVMLSLDSVPIAPVDRPLGLALAILGLGAVAYYAASLWFVPRSRRRVTLSTLDAFRFAEFAAAGLGAWVGFVASAGLWDSLFGFTYGYFGWFCYSSFAVLPIGAASVHGVFLLRALRRRLHS